ncbi:MAG TPA: hypothetical protein VF216_09805 [Mizugakiibacter sp.]
MAALNDKERRTLRRIEEAIAQADRSASPEELAAVKHELQQPAQQAQQELTLPPAA